MSGRPIVTSSIGEINLFFTHLDNAYISKPEDVHGFAENLINIIRYPDQAKCIGEKGKKLAMTYFDYRQYGKILEEFLFFNKT
jgi:glycosyltransferase involved in cell wall biosynthesis